MTAERPVSASAEDDRLMAAALGLARRGLGRVWPNPAVGCIVVREGAVVGRGWTQPGGRPHAETEALGRAGPAAAGADVYVSLEPCDHLGATAPCTEALIAAGIGRCVVAVEDPDPRTNGGGVARLRDAGIAITLGVRGREAAELNAGFFLRCRHGRPLFTLKMATSLDGRIATAGGESRWITGAAARRVVHAMRASHDAVLVGSQTALADDPDLGCRLPGMEDRSPVRVVADARLRLSSRSRLLATAGDRPTWILTRPDADERRSEMLRARGVTVIAVAPADDGAVSAGARPGTESGAGGGLDPRAAAQALAERGITRVLIEGGGRLAAAFAAADLVDRIAWFRAPLVLGADGVPAMGALGIETLAAAPRFVRAGQTVLDDDILETLTRAG